MIYAETIIEKNDNHKKKYSWKKFHACTCGEREREGERIIEPVSCWGRRSENESLYQNPRILERERERESSDDVWMRWVWGR